jgi:excisionase family DNA binding protein
MDDPLLYTISDCCRLAAIGRTKLYELIGSGALPTRKIGRRTVIAAADLRNWIERLPAGKHQALAETARREQRR